MDDELDFETGFSEQPQSEDDQQSRNECLQRFVADALNQEDSFEANFKLVQASLFQASQVLDARLRRLVSDASPLAGSSEQLAENIEMQIRLARESERLAKFATRHEQQELEIMRRSGGFHPRK